MLLEGYTHGTQGLQLKSYSWDWRLSVATKGLGLKVWDWTVSTEGLQQTGYNQMVTTKGLWTKTWDWRFGTKVLELATEGFQLNPCS